MKKLMLSLILFTFSAMNCWADGVVGYWKTIDDKTDKPKSIIHITKHEDEFRGKIVRLLNPEKQNAVCDECDGDKKDKPVLGMEIMWGFEEAKSGKTWEDGEILDPENGKVYSCKLTLKNDGQELDVRGYIGFSWIGRTQTWLRASEQDVAAR